MKKEKTNQFVELLKINKPAEVAFLKSILETEKIPYFIQGEKHNTMEGIPAIFLVPSTHIKRAKELVNHFLGYKGDILY